MKEMELTDGLGESQDDNIDEIPPQRTSGEKHGKNRSKPLDNEQLEEIYDLYSMDALLLPFKWSMTVEINKHAYLQHSDWSMHNLEKAMKDDHDDELRLPYIDDGENNERINELPVTSDPDVLDPHSSHKIEFYSDFDSYKQAQQELLWKNRFIHKTQLLEQQQSEQYKRDGPLGSRSPPRQAPELLDQRIQSRSKFNWIVTDITELHNSRVSVAVRGSDGQLRTPTVREFMYIRRREKHPKAPFYYTRFTLPDAPRM